MVTHVFQALIYIFFLFFSATKSDLEGKKKGRKALLRKSSLRPVWLQPIRQIDEKTDQSSVLYFILDLFN